MRLPKLSIVTPSYNQGEFLEATLLSVLDQDYPNIEYIVLDGGSTDRSRDVIESHANKISYWRSEPDAGQALALIEGFQRSTGEILAWLNSDDTYLPGAVSEVAEIFTTKPEVDVVVGNALFVDTDGSPMEPYTNRSTSPTQLSEFWRGWPIPQPATFFRRRAYDRVSGLRPDLNFAIDLDLFLRMAHHCRFEYIDTTLATYRVHGDSKTSDWRTSRVHFWTEAARVTKPFWPPRTSPRRWWQAASSAWHLRLAELDKRRGTRGSPE